MELILISRSKLKIMLTADDMENYSISADSLTYEKRDTRRAFERILDEAREKTGFDSTSGRLFIQVYPSKNGGCEVYVISNEEDKKCEKKQDKGGTKEVRTPPKPRVCQCVYGFDTIERVISASRALRGCGYDSDSSLYWSESGERETRYYLALREEIDRENRYKKRKSLSKSDVAGEFGRRMGGRETLIYINEHCRSIIEGDAVERMAEL